jgi:hypothetical protein
LDVFTTRKENAGFTGFLIRRRGILEKSEPVWGLFSSF